MHVLKLTKGIVKSIAVIISLAFFLNSITGLLGTFGFVENESVNVDPGDIRVNFEDLFLNISIEIENNGIYDLEEIIIGINFSIKSDVVDYTSVLDTDSTILDDDIPSEGQKIGAGETSKVELAAQLDDFELTPEQIGTLFNLTGSWDLADLVDTGFDVSLKVYFQIKYAYKQYQLFFDLFVAEDVVKDSIVGGA